MKGSKGAERRRGLGRAAQGVLGDTAVQSVASGAVRCHCKGANSTKARGGLRCVKTTARRSSRAARQASIAAVALNHSGLETSCKQQAERCSCGGRSGPTLPVTCTLPPSHLGGPRMEHRL